LARLHLVYGGDLKEADEECLKKEPLIRSIQASITASENKGIKANSFIGKMTSESTIDKGFFLRGLKIRKNVIYTEFDCPERAELLLKFFTDISRIDKNDESGNS